MDSPGVAFFRNRKRLLNVMAVVALLVAALPMSGVRTTKAAPTELFFSEYIEGSSNNKALEIYNGTGTAVNLATAGYKVEMYFNGSGSPSLTINLTGSVANGDVFVLAQSSAAAAILVQADQTNGSGWYNGDDAVVLRKGTTIVDVIGQIGFDPGTEWGTGFTSTADNTLLRKPGIEAGDTNGADAFDPSVEWNGYATDTFSWLGSYGDPAPAFLSTSPANGAFNVALNSDITVTFTEPVNVTGSWFSISCTTSGAHTAAVSGGPTTFTLNPDGDFVNRETCTLTAFAAQVTDQDTNDPPDNMAADQSASFYTDMGVCSDPFTHIYNIQGSGLSAAITGNVTTEGVVVGDYEGPSPTLRGFYLQDLTSDSNPATSDGIFVFNNNNNNVSLGDVVRISGTAAEFQDQTQITLGSFAGCGTGSVTPTDVTFPVPSLTYLEQYEGMLVRLPQTLYVTEHFQLGRFGQVVMSANARLQQPTNMVAPGAPALELQEQNNLNRIIIDDASQVQNPDPILFARGGQPLSASNTLRGGDTATGIVGIMSYTWAGNSASGNAYRVRPINALGGGVPNFEPANPRPASAPVVTGTTKVAGMNLLNFFNTFDGLPDNVDNCTNGVGGPATDCRGADTQAEFDRQWPKTVAAILKLDADVLGVNEIENDGYGSDSAMQFLVNKLNYATAPGTYAFIDADAATGQVNAMGTDAIKVGLLYKPANVSPVGQTAVLNTVAFVNGGDSAPRSRPTIAQAFEVNATGARFIVDVNHLKSKGSACDAPDAGDGQGNCNQVRVNSATALVNWLATDPTSTGDPDILLIGDYNSYAKEDPITVIKNAGFTNLIETVLGPDAYSYVFDGQWGYLDHALGSASIVSQIDGVGDYHINSDEPSVLDYNTDFKTPNLITTLYAPDEFRVSDHDSVLIGLDLTNAPPIATDDTMTVQKNSSNVVYALANDYDPENSQLTVVSFTQGANGEVKYSTKNNNFRYTPRRGFTGTDTFTYTITDGYGNTDTATVYVTVR